jgi:hypothetical protein
MRFQSFAHIGKKLSNIFKRFYTIFKRFYTLFKYFQTFSNVFERFLHELARLMRKSALLIEILTLLRINSCPAGLSGVVPMSYIGTKSEALAKADARLVRNSRLVPDLVLENPLPKHALLRK